MAKRAISEQTKEMFSQYGKTMGQRMSREEAMTMLNKEFHLNQDEANVVFDVFDSDSNGQLSMWEFQHFYDNVGHRARAMMDLFQQLEDKANSGTLDMEKAFDKLKAMKKKDDVEIKDEDLSMRMKFYAGAEKSIDLPKFINLVCNLGLVLAEDANNHH